MDELLIMVLQSSNRMKEVFIKKYWEEGDATFYLHFKDGEPIRQIESTREGVFLTTMESPFDGDSMLYDQSLSDLKLEDGDTILKSEFEEAWNKYDLLDKRR